MHGIYVGNVAVKANVSTTGSEAFFDARHMCRRCRCEVNYVGYSFRWARFRSQNFSGNHYQATIATIVSKLEESMNRDRGVVSYQINESYTAARVVRHSSCVTATVSSEHRVSLSRSCMRICS